MNHDQPGADQRNAAVPNASLRNDHLVLHAARIRQPGNLVEICSGDASGRGLRNTGRRAAAYHRGFRAGVTRQAGANRFLQFDNLDKVLRRALHGSMHVGWHQRAGVKRRHAAAVDHGSYA